MSKKISFILTLAILVVLLFVPVFVEVKYYIHLCTLALIWVIISQGQNLIQGYTGYVSITQAGFMGVGAYCSALLSLRLGMPVWATMLIAPFATAIFAVIVGYPSLRVKGHYFAIVTLAYNLVIYIVLVNFTQLTNGEAGLAGIGRPEGWINFKDRINYYYLTLAAAIFITGLTALIVHSRIGKILMAIRQNETLVGAAGITAWHYKLLSFVISGSFAGFAGALYAHYQKFINRDVFGVAQSLDAILAVIVGGSGTILGPIAGSFFVVFLPEYLRIADSFRLIVYGILLILATIYMPRGLMPLIINGITRIFRKKAK